MIVWGGDDNDYNHPVTRGVYDPETNTWAPTSTVETVLESGMIKVEVVLSADQSQFCRLTVVR